MKWYCFLFWFVYRFVLACLAHFNWSLALYTNCIYFSLWKSYDLLWFWMHLILCSCFPQLRRENYLIVWANLIYKRCTQYPHLTYKQLYLALYGGKGTKAERALMRMDTIEKRERESKRESRRLRKLTDTETSSSSSSDEDTNVDANQLNTRILHRADPSVPTIIEQEQEECRKYVYVGEAVDSTTSFPAVTSESTPVPPPRRARAENNGSSPASATTRSSPPIVTFDLEERNEGDAEDEASGGESDSGSTTKWFKKVPNAIAKKFRRGTSSTQSQKTTSDQLSAPNGANDQQPDNVSISTWNRIRGFIPNPLKNRSISNDATGNEIDILRPDYSNTYDVLDPKIAEKRAKRDRKHLTTRLRKRLREELREEARKERKRRMITDSIELLLQLLRMMASFAILVGNIRKTFIPAQFKYLRPGQHAYDNYELILLFRVTTTMDICMFYLNIGWVYCLQWHLCCRLGFLRFWSWAALLCSIAFVTMLMPMSYAMNQMDLSWCRFMPNSTLEHYQPKW